MKKLIQLGKLSFLQWLLCVGFSIGFVWYLFFGKGGLSPELLRTNTELLNSISGCYFILCLFAMIVVSCWNMVYVNLKLQLKEENHSGTEQTSSSVLRFIEPGETPDIFLAQHQKSMSFFYKNPKLATSVPKEEIMIEFMASVQAQNMLNTLHMQRIVQDIQKEFYSINGIAEPKLVYRLWKSLFTEYPKQYLYSIPVTKQAEEDRKKIRKAQHLASNYEFAVRIVFYIIADWCIHIYAEHYQINKDMFFVSKENSEQENIVSRLNHFKGSLLDGQAKHLNEMVTLEFSLKSHSSVRLTGELEEIYQSCCSLLNKS